MKKWIFILPVVLFVNAEAKEVQEIRYENLPDLVREKNENVKASQASLEAKEYRTGHLTRSFLPSLDLKGGQESAKWDSTSTIERAFWSVDGKINIYRGGRDGIEEDIRVARVESAKIEYLREYQSELREARKTYWQLVAIGKTLVELKDAIKRNEENVRVAQKRAGAGVATNADAVQFDLENTLLVQQLKKLTLDEDLLRSKLATAIAQESHKSLSVKLEFPHPPDELPREAQIDPQSQLEVRLLRSGESIERLKRKSAARWWLPSVDAYSSYGLPSLSSNDGRAIARDKQWMAGVQVTFGLGQAYEDRAMANAHEAEQRAASLRVTHRAREATATNHELLHDLKLMHELIHDSEKDIEKAFSFLKLTKSEYSRGVKNGPDLLEAYARYFSFRTRQIDLLREYYETQAELAYHTAF